MAELNAAQQDIAFARPIPAHTQLLAVAWLRWRIFVNNSFRRPPKGARQMIGLLLVSLFRLIFWIASAVMMIVPAIGSGFLAWMAVAHNRPQDLLFLLTGLSVLWVFVSLYGLNFAATINSFDPSSLARFPLRFGRYLVLRTLLGLFTGSTIMGCLALLAAAIGIGVANHALQLPALIVLAIYALTNIFLNRMLAAWLERLLAGRRFREIFGVLMSLALVAIQLLRFTRGPRQGAGALSIWSLNPLHRAVPYLRWLPPGFAANSILRTPHLLTAIMQIAALLAWTVLFLAIYAIRLHKQFLGEYLSDSPARAKTSASELGGRRYSQQPAAVPLPTSPERVRTPFSPVIGACLRKEWLTFWGNGVQFIGMLIPAIMIVVLNRGTLAHHPEFFLPVAIGYILLMFLAGLYNIFGADGSGVQLYLLAPVRLRDVILAKNIASVILLLFEAMLAWTLVSALTTAPLPLADQISVALWTIFVIATNLGLGTLRSIQAPRRFVPGQTPQIRRTPVDRTSSLLVLAVFLGSILLQIPVTVVGRQIGQPWLGALVFAPLAAIALTGYLLLLHYADRLVLSHRDRMADELCRV